MASLRRVLSPTQPYSRLPRPRPNRISRTEREHPLGERPRDYILPFHRIVKHDGAAEMGNGAAVTVSCQPVQSGLCFRAGSQVLLDAVLDGRRADAQRFLLVRAVAGAIRPDAKICDFV